MPSKSIKSSIYAGLMLLALSVQVQSATLTGDFVEVNYNESSAPNSNGNGIVGLGPDPDVQIGGGLYDFNAGALEDQFIFSVDENYCGVAACVGPIKLSLLNLNFSGGEQLVGFTLVSSTLLGLTFTFTSTSLIFLATEGDIGPGPVISGIFLTQPPAVPIPAALPLLAAGISAMGFMGWRRKRKSAAVS